MLDVISSAWRFTIRLKAAFLPVNHPFNERDLSSLPELPEIEHLRQTLLEPLVGQRVLMARLRRSDVLRRSSPGRADQLLLSGQTMLDLRRRGKQLAIIGDAGVICVHLGMSGQLFLTDRSRFGHSEHVHAVWSITSPTGPRRLVFRDPRRFGGLWSFESIDQLESTRWHRLGPDAVAIRSRDFADRLQRTRRPIKTALLDQAVIAGVGNIYADESLHRARVHPERPACELQRAEVTRVASAVRDVLRHAIRAGGSTLRDYRDGSGNAGEFQSAHLVYGRGGEACTSCGHVLTLIRLAQRATVFCERCQPRTF
ncbi:MAG: bifunctional DNA-formamidopyrimidine glycosylase/DNA-(apurinic or apyrimidinic site) lyase [Planctomycetota bacterium]